MSRFLFLLLMLYDFHSILALFTVTAPKLTYTARRGDTVQMICNFPLTEDEDINKLKVSWQHLIPKQSLQQQIIMFSNGRQDSLNQESTYSGRVTLLTEELKKGEAILQIKDVKLTDAGIYLCALQLSGSDYQQITLEVQASYTNIQSSIQISPTDNEMSLTCQSLGYPEAEVYWQIDGINVSSPANTSHTLTRDGFFNTTSTIKGIDMSQNYNCVFWNKALNEKTEAAFGYPGLVKFYAIHRMSESASNKKTSPQKNDHDDHISSSQKIIVIVCTVLFLVSLLSVIICVRKQRCFKCFKKKGDCSATI